jgi:MFS family permease
VSTIIPTIVADLHSASGYVWIGGAYLLANAAGSNIWVNLSDIWGRKPILLGTVTLFFVSSIVCAKAVDMTMMIVGRAFQGVAGGGLMQLVMVTISDLFSVRHRSLYFGLLEFMWALAGAIGPLMGGALTQRVSWRWAYWINLPVCGLALLLLVAFLDVHNPRTAFFDGIRAIDWAGSLAILGMTLMLLLGLNFGGDTFAWSSPTVICLIIAGCLMSLVFIYCEKRLAKYPLMPLGVFQSNIPSFVIAFCQGAVYIPPFYLHTSDYSD